MIAEGKPYFLSRPRRFGKSLFLDTLKELFEGNRVLFTGLHAESRWDWSVRHPVVRLSLGDGVFETREDLAAGLHKQLSRLEQEHGLSQRFPDPRGRLLDLIETLHDRTGQRVVVLIDEYDKPILDNLTEPRSRPSLASAGSAPPWASDRSRPSLASAASAPPWASRAYLFEFKVVEQVPDGRAPLSAIPGLRGISPSLGKPLAQLQAKGYAEKYRAPGVPVTLVGVEFSRDQRNVVGFEVAAG